jgi:hypothetical protein
MNIIQLWERIDNSLKSFVDTGLHEFHFSHVKLSDSGYLKSGGDLSRSFSLCFGQSDIDQLGS